MPSNATTTDFSKKEQFQMTPPINRIDLERVLKTLPPETQDPFPNLANLTAIELLKRRVWISAQLKTLEQERKAIDLEIEETYSIAELKYGIAISGGWIMKSNTRTSWEYTAEVIEEIKAIQRQAQQSGLANEIRTTHLRLLQHYT